MRVLELTVLRLWLPIWQFIGRQVEVTEYLAVALLDFAVERLAGQKLALVLALALQQGP